MQIKEIKRIFQLAGRPITSNGIDDRYRVGEGGKHWSLEALEREANRIVKQLKKADRRGVTPLHCLLAVVEVKKHCSQYCNKISKSKLLSKAQKKEHYEQAYRERDERLSKISEMQSEVGHEI